MKLWAGIPDPKDVMFVRIVIAKKKKCQVVFQKGEAPSFCEWNRI